MGRRILIKVTPVVVVAELNETRTAQAIWNMLPIKGRVNLWGKEIYFSIPLNLELEDGREVVNVGDLGYWPEGSAFCIFFGSTPVSRGGEIRPASPVTVFGRIIGEGSWFEKVTSGTVITVERKEDNYSD